MLKSILASAAMALAVTAFPEVNVADFKEMTFENMIDHFNF
jgi:hypothetical protein